MPEQGYIRKKRKGRAFTHRSPRSDKRRHYDEHPDRITRNERRLQAGDETSLGSPGELRDASIAILNLLLDKNGVPIPDEFYMEDGQGNRFLPRPMDHNGYEVDGVYIYPPGEFEIYGSSGDVYRNTATGRRTHTWAQEVYDNE